MKRYYDTNFYEVLNGHIIDLHQTVNGQSEFIIVDLENLDVRYAYNPKRKYEYDVDSLLSPSKLTNETEYEIIGITNIDDIPKAEEITKIKSKRQTFNSINQLPKDVDLFECSIDMKTWGCERHSVDVMGCLECEYFIKKKYNEK